MRNDEANIKPIRLTLILMIALITCAPHTQARSCEKPIGPYQGVIRCEAQSIDYLGIKERITFIGCSCLIQTQ